MRTEIHNILAMNLMENTFRGACQGKHSSNTPKRKHCLIICQETQKNIFSKETRTKTINT